MAKKTLRLLNSQRVVSTLTHQLGTPVAWAAWLADQRRNDPDRRPPDLHGYHLLPAFRSDSGQPLYLPADVKAFIAAVRAANPGMRSTSADWYVIDDTPSIPWRMRRARRCIKARVLPSIVGAPRKPRPPKADPASSGPAPI